MIKRLLLYMVAATLLLAAAISADQWDEDTTLLEEYAGEISGYLDAQVADAQNWLAANRIESLSEATESDALKSLFEKDYTLFRLQGDSLIFWSNAQALPERSQWAEWMSAGTPPRAVRLPLGDYALTHAGQAADNIWLLIPIRHDLAKHPFPASRSICPEVVFSTVKTDYPVLLQGQPIGHLAAAAPIHAGWLQALKLIFFGLFLFLLLSAAAQVAQVVSQRWGATAGVLTVALVSAGAIALNRTLGLTEHLLGGMAVFAHHFEQPSWLGASLGDWLLSMLLLLWTATFFYRHWRPAVSASSSTGLRWAAALGGYAGAAVLLWCSVSIMRHLIFSSGLYFDFDNLLLISGLSWWAIGGLMVWMAAAFLFSHRLVLTAKRAALSLPERYMAMGGGLAVLTILTLTTGIGSPLYLLGFGVAYLALFDFLVHDDAPGFGWVVAWLLLLSLFVATTLYGYNDVQDRSRRLAYAEALANDRDSEEAEQRLPALYAAFQQDSARLGMMLKPFPFKADMEDVRAFFNQKLFADNYFFQHYRIQVFGFDQTGQPLLRDQTQSAEWAIQENWNAGQALAGGPAGQEIRLHTDRDGRFRYMMLFRPLRMGDPTQPSQVFCFLDHEYPKQTRVYARLFYSTPYKALSALNQYDYAVEKFGHLVVESGTASLVALGKGLANGQSEDIERPALGRLDAVYKSADGSTVAVVGRPGGGWYKPLYLFAILFALSSVLVFALAFSDRWLHFLPGSYRISLTMRGSLSKRIHYGMLALVAVAFLAISVLTYRHFTQSAADAEQANVNVRAEMVAANLRAQVLGSSLSTDSLRRTLPKSLAVLAGSFAMDANLYDPSGSLLFTTQPDLLQAGVLSEKMSPNALLSLKNGALPAFEEQERLAGMRVSTEYLPLRDGQNRMLGFLGIPYDSGAKRTDASVSDFLGMLATLYVLLLVVAFAVSYMLANSIIKPLRLVSEKIQQLQLDNNEQLHYAGDTQDEIGELIERYNLKVVELEASKSKMVKLEREGAWREMARQVAHDIKNPLTTMKLSMQQLERVSNNPEQAAAFLRKAITRLIEQIDSLAQIASEFSMFANLDIRERHPMSLNDAVESVFDLFSEQKHLDFDLTLPNEQLTIAGDKNHLIRVLNNLVINATQAIPSDRRGKIQVSLRREGETAIVQISDNGGGIPAEIQDRVFEPNFTTKTSGSGLGLAICRKIIEGHDGTIRFETRENEGTSFMVELPVTGVTTANGTAFNSAPVLSR